MNQTATVLPMPVETLEEFKPYRSELAKLKKENSTLIFDYASKTGYKEARSYIAKLRKTKTPVSDLHKQLKADSLAYGKKLDAEKNHIIGEIDAMINVHQTAVDNIDAAEEKRLEEIKGRVAFIAGYQECVGHDSKETATALVELHSMAIDESFGDQFAEAMQAKEKAISAQEMQHQIALKQEADAAELTRLQKEAKEREQRDHEDRIRREAEEKARRAAEDERVAAATREADLKLAAQQAALDKHEAEQRAARELKAAEDRRLVEAAAAEEARLAAEKKAEADRIAAVAEEKARAQREADAKAAIEAARAADEAHRAKIRLDIIEAISRVTGMEQEAITVADAILGGDVPHIQVIF